MSKPINDLPKIPRPDGDRDVVPCTTNSQGPTSDQDTAGAMAILREMAHALGLAPKERT